MSDTADVQHRYHHRGRADSVDVREVSDGDGSGMMEIRLPIASTGEVRNQGDDPLTPDEMQGMAEQVDAMQTGVFPSHGDDNLISVGRYSPFEKLGYWQEATIERGGADDGSDLLMATARMPDPETLPAATGDYRQALAILKEQAKRGIPIDASIGWRDDENYPGGVDLMEASIVGIGADPRTQTETSSAEQTALLARAAVDAGADPESFVGAVRAAVERARDSDATPDDARPFGPPGGDEDKWDSFDECVADVEEWDNIDDAEAFCGWAQEQTESSAAADAPDDARAEYEVNGEMINITPPEYVVAAAEAALDAEQRDDVTGDCGTGVGDRRANQILTDDVGPEVIDEMAAYLTSHEEDVTAEGPPSEWSAEEWSDCGNRQYAKWGGDGSGDALNWAQGKANEVAAALGEDEPYPDRAADAPDPRDTDTDTDTDTDMTETDTADEPDGGTTETTDEQADDAASDERGACPECDADVTETANYCPNCGERLADAEESEMDDDEGGDEDDGDDEEEDDGEMQTSASDADTEGDVDVSDLEQRLSEMRDELDTLRSQGMTGDDIERPEADAETDDDADADSTDRDADDGDAETTDQPDFRDKLFGST